MSSETGRILVIGDEVVPAFYQYYRPGIFKGIDLIISCGDLPARYLEFIATVFNGDVLYVPGNHDEDYVAHPPLGCINIDGRLFVWRGLRIFGLGGSMRYKEGPYQYTQKEMKRRLRKAWLQLFSHQGIDIFVSHAPPFGLHDSSDLCHTGFEAFVTVLEKYKPKYYIYGHVHMNYGDFPRTDTFESTLMVNSFRQYVLDIDLPSKQKRHS